MFIKKFHTKQILKAFQKQMASPSSNDTCFTKYDRSRLKCIGKSICKI
jgi:hypothetical protein